MHNPRIDDIATRVDTLQSEGIPFLSAVSRVAEMVGISINTVDSCYAAALTGDYSDMASDRLEWLDERIPAATPDPFDTGVDDWNEDYWR